MFHGSWYEISDDIKFIYNVLISFNFINFKNLINCFSIIEVTNPPPSTSDPVECNSDNEGNCECGDTSKGFTTYTFSVGDVQRCFTVFYPISRMGEKLPVVLSPNCYAKDKLIGIDMTNDLRGDNAVATKYGYSRIGLSTPDGGWTFGNDNIVNDEKPMPCSEQDSKDISYLKVVFHFIESNPDKFDADKIYAEGFSQNAMFSAYTAFCFHDKVLGVWQGGSGLALTGERPFVPNQGVHNVLRVLLKNTGLLVGPKTRVLLVNTGQSTRVTRNLVQ